MQPIRPGTWNLTTTCFDGTKSSPTAVTLASGTLYTLVVIPNVTSGRCEGVLLRDSFGDYAKSGDSVIEREGLYACVRASEEEIEKENICSCSCHGRSPLSIYLLSFLTSSF